MNLTIAESQLIAMKSFEKLGTPTIGAMKLAIEEGRLDKWEVHELTFAGMKPLYHTDAAKHLTDPNNLPSIIFVARKGWQRFDVTSHNILAYHNGQVYRRLSWRDIGMKGKQQGLSKQQDKHRVWFFIPCHKLNNDEPALAHTVELLKGAMK